MFDLAGRTASFTNSLRAFIVYDYQTKAKQHKIVKLQTIMLWTWSFLTLPLKSFFKLTPSIRPDGYFWNCPRKSCCFQLDRRPPDNSLVSGELFLIRRNDFLFVYFVLKLCFLIVITAKIFSHFITRWSERGIFCINFQVFTSAGAASGNNYKE